MNKLSQEEVAAIKATYYKMYITSQALSLIELILKTAAVSATVITCLRLGGLV